MINSSFPVSNIAQAKGRRLFLGRYSTAGVSRDDLAGESRRGLGVVFSRVPIASVEPDSVIQRPARMRAYAAFAPP
jgi:hypothetical protein